MRLKLADDRVVAVLELATAQLRASGEGRKSGWCCFWGQIPHERKPLADHRRIAFRVVPFLCEEIVARAPGYWVKGAFVALGRILP